MAVSPAETVAAQIATDDPRICEQFVSVIPGDSETHETVLIGTVHDHPASAYRVQKLVGAINPETVAIEIPPLAVPLFEQATGSGSSPPAVGGSEMTAALDAHQDGNVLGIDSFGPSFFRYFLAEANSGSASRSDMWAALEDVWNIQKQTLSCRMKARFDRLTDLFDDILVRFADVFDDALIQFEHDVTQQSPPQAQARDELAKVSKNRSLLSAVERPVPEQLLDSARERNMSSRILSLRKDGVVVAVVGFDHLEPLTKRLDTQ